VTECVAGFRSLPFETGHLTRSFTPKDITMRTPAKVALSLLAVAAASVMSGAAFAVDTVISKDAPDLTSPRAKIKAKDFVGAIAELAPILATHQHADVYNLMGFSLRKSGDVKQAASFYAKALDFDPDHKGALEYQGEMFVELGQIDKAKANLSKLVALCPKSCEEREDLEKAISINESGAKTN
jgi:tetratricopeptide (TPR) repeat protein